MHTHFFLLFFDFFLLEERAILYHIWKRGGEGVATPGRRPKKGEKKRDQAQKKDTGTLQFFLVRCATGSLPSIFVLQLNEVFCMEIKGHVAK